MQSIYSVHNLSHVDPERLLLFLMQKGSLDLELKKTGFDKCQQQKAFGAFTESSLSTIGYVLILPQKSQTVVFSLQRNLFFFDCPVNLDTGSRKNEKLLFCTHQCLP